MISILGVPHVRIFVLRPQWQAAVSFYESILHLRLVNREEEEGVAVFGISPDVTLSVERIEPEDKEHRSLAGRLVAVSFGIKDISRAYQELSSAGVKFEGIPETQPWGGKLAFFRDPGDNVLTLVEVA